MPINTKAAIVSICFRYHPSSVVLLKYHTLANKFAEPDFFSPLSSFHGSLSAWLEA